MKRTVEHIIDDAKLNGTISENDILQLKVMLDGGIELDLDFFRINKPAIPAEQAAKLMAWLREHEENNVANYIFSVDEAAVVRSSTYSIHFSGFYNKYTGNTPIFKVESPHGHFIFFIEDDKPFVIA